MVLCVREREKEKEKFSFGERKAGVRLDGVS